MPSSAHHKRLLASVTALLVIVVMLGMVVVISRQPSAGMQASLGGWCCLQKGDACMNGFQPLDCYNAAGFAFSSDETICQQACGNSH